MHASVIGLKTSITEAILSFMSIREINEKTSLPFKVVAPIVSTLIFGTWVLSAKLGDIEAKLDNQWTVKNQQRWADHMRQRNPNISVPYVSDILSDTRIN